MKPQSTCLGDEKVPRNLARWSERLARVLARNVSFGATMNNTDKDINLDVWKASGITPGVANTDFTIPHSLGRIPITIVGQDTDNLGLIGRSPTTPWTKTTVTLRCSTASAHYKVILA
jgi:hypothetical protein